MVVLEKMKVWVLQKRQLISTIGFSDGGLGKVNRDDSQLVNDIVKDVRKMLSLSYPNELKNFIQKAENNIDIESLLREHKKIGIWGSGGMGKTTIAKYLFACYFAQYDSVCLLENVREDTEKNGVTHVRNKLLCELLRRPVTASEVVGLHTFIKRSLIGKKVLVVLDDVDNMHQLDNLCSYLDELGPD
ncbi:disease resistance protein, partial [Trifolium medium]|nr:disease resistance protein [Trifolium medium]